MHPKTYEILEFDGIEQGRAAAFSVPLTKQEAKELSGIVMITTKPEHSEKRFIFSVQFDQVLSIDEIWPDGDAPENPTADDAREVFLANTYGHIGDKLIDWNIAPVADDLYVCELAPGSTFNGE